MLLIDIFVKNERSLEEIIQAYENAKSWLESKGTVNLIFLGGFNFRFNLKHYAIFKFCTQVTCVH